MDKIFNNTFFNSLFTSDEFDFIEHMDSDIESASELLEKEQKDRDLIVNLINNLDESIYFHRVNQESFEDDDKVLQAAKNAFDLVNFNISVLQSNTELSNSIKKEIVNLLIKIDADGENVSESKYLAEITDLKNKISNITNNIEDTKSKIDFNQHAISDFFNTFCSRIYKKFQLRL